MEYLEGVDLDKYRENNNTIHRNIIIKIIKQIVDAVAYIHSVDVVHKDIKGANIIINPSTHFVKLIDFGFSRGNLCSPEERHYESQEGTPIYMAPELFIGDTNSRQMGDIWALGVTIYFLIVSDNNYDFVNMKSFNITTNTFFMRLLDIFGPVKSEDAIQVPKYVSTNGKNSLVGYKTSQYNSYDIYEFYDRVRADLHDIIPILQQIFIINPYKRISAYQILNSSPFKDADDKTVTSLQPCVATLRTRDKYISYAKYDKKHASVVRRNDKIVETTYLNLVFKNIELKRTVRVFQLTCWMFDAVYMRHYRLENDPRHIPDVMSCCYYIAYLFYVGRNVEFISINGHHVALDAINRYVETILNRLNFDLVHTTSINYSTIHTNLYKFLSYMIYVSNSLKYNILGEGLNDILSEAYYKITGENRKPLNEIEALFFSDMRRMLIDKGDIVIDRIDLVKRITELMRQ
jgi:serine/threonine protein kinase